MTAHLLTPDTQAILLLCGSLGSTRGADAQPLGPSEYHQLAQWLYSAQLRPSDLLSAEGFDTIHEREPVRFDAERIGRLLSRGAALAIAVETWTNRGLWVISRGDSQYPQRLRTSLGKSAPPILYGVGAQERLNDGGLAIVGSREIDAAAITFTIEIATRAAQEGMQVVSGGARGVDSEAMQAALDAGGTVIGVLADSLLKAAVAGKYRTALRDGRLALVTAYDPNVGFHVGNAMGRNKQIYTLSDYALVVSSSLEEGGTWSGAVENLARQWVPLFIRATEPMLPGNQRLLERGGIACESAAIPADATVATWMYAQSTAPLARIREADSAQSNVDYARRSPASGAEVSQLQHDLFPIVWPHLEQGLQTTRTDRELADMFGIELAQARAWLQRALEQRLVQKLPKPVRYIAVAQIGQAETLPLFS